MFRRAAALTFAALALGTAVTAPAATAADACTWTAHSIAAPDGYLAADVDIRGTDSHGGYSGTVSDRSVNMSRVVLWTGGEPRIPDALAKFVYPSVADENSAGTVLLDGGSPSAEWGVYLFSGGHLGPGTLTRLPDPPGYRLESAVGLNDRGDVLASATDLKDGHRVSVLWSVLAAGPRIIDIPDRFGLDLDDDGTVLLRAPDNQLGGLWRAGVVTPLTGEDRPVLIRQIRNGVVVGTAIDSWPASRALAWHGPADPRPLEQGGTAEATNKHGLIAGSLTNLIGPAAVWQDTRLLGRLPFPDGGDADVFVIGDDGVIFGNTSNAPAALRWTCD
ncbi:Uncharacterised protein [Amycolatopsis camponoti]|uniref:Uncharacterized protein n=1 Tax=Amycolatopsis camponoti TaxID=2606593 RepID=A0A6I8LSZ7_9PSEU|nr:hypothetical protein [Amycolatopsis camponoti]VVJ18229.1 Uncharacterised protein [Amycolatopsis camponoti]